MGWLALIGWILAGAFLAIWRKSESDWTASLKRDVDRLWMRNQDAAKLAALWMKEVYDNRKHDGGSDKAFTIVAEECARAFADKPPVKLPTEALYAGGNQSWPDPEEFVPRLLNGLAERGHQPE